VRENMALSSSPSTTKKKKKKKKKFQLLWLWWLKPLIIDTQEAQIRRITVQSQPHELVCEIPSQKNSSQKMASGVAQGVDPEFKPQNGKKLYLNILLV
jgi:hypothetical protein